MKILRQSIIIFGLYLLGELLSHTFNLPIPGNIIGMLLLLLLLCTNVIKVEKIESVSNFFLDHLAFFFIPAGVGILDSFGVVRENFVKLFIICIVTTIVTIAATGICVQYISRKLNKKKEV